MWESRPKPPHMLFSYDFRSAFLGLPAVGWSGSPGVNLKSDFILHSFHSPSTPDP